MPLKVGVHEKGGLRQYDALVIVVREHSKPSEFQAVFGDALSKYVVSAIEKHRFKGGDGSMLVLTPAEPTFPSTIAVIGCGKHSESLSERVRRVVGLGIKEAESAKAASVVVGMVGEYALEERILGEILTESVFLATYAFRKYKTGTQAKSNIKTIALMCGDRKRLVAFEDGVRQGRHRAEAVIIARDLVNEPGHAMVPKTLADAARAVAADEGKIKVAIHGKSEIERLGMGAYLGVAQGSIHEPQLIHLTYTPSQKPKKVIAIIGKGITFDSGGLSLKPSHAMETMKCDMAGAAAVIGLFHALAKLDVPLEVHGIAPVCENMISAQATRPGDILKSMSGKTIEVLNTDAEGRLTLADAITYAKETVKPDVIIDLATLTGACISALGEDIAGVMGNNEELIAAVLEAGKTSGEMLWRLPLPAEYKPMLKSTVADYTNITPSKKGAGASTAGLFLQEFVGTTPWVHMDIAGPAFAESATVSYMPKGGTGFGVRTLIALLHQLSA